MMYPQVRFDSAVSGCRSPKIEAQAAAVSDVPNAGYIDIRDQPDDGLHPKNKKPIGERLAERALAEYIK